MARRIIGPRKPRKLRKPLKSTVKAVRERSEKFGAGFSEEAIHEIALSEDQYIEDWKAALIHVIDDPPTKPKKRAVTAKKKKGKVRK